MLPGLLPALIDYAAMFSWTDFVNTTGCYLAWRESFQQEARLLTQVSDKASAHRLSRSECCVLRRAAMAAAAAVEPDGAQVLDVYGRHPK